MILWDGESENAGGGWNGPGNTQFKAQNAVAHHGTRALHAHTSGMDFANFGWNWRSWQPSSPRDDATPYAYLMVAIKVGGAVRPSGMHFGLRNPLAEDRNKERRIQRHRRAQVSAPPPSTARWHDIAIPFRDVTGKPGFDLRRLWEARRCGSGPRALLDCDVYIDDIGYGGKL